VNSEISKQESTEWPEVTLDQWNYFAQFPSLPLDLLCILSLGINPLGYSSADPFDWEKSVHELQEAEKNTAKPIFDDEVGTKVSNSDDKEWEGVGLVILTTIALSQRVPVAVRNLVPYGEIPIADGIANGEKSIVKVSAFVDWAISQNWEVPEGFRNLHKKPISTKTVSFSPAAQNFPMTGPLLPIIEARYTEIERCLEADAPLAVIFHCGGILEGLLLNVADTNPEQFKQASNSPKNKSGQVKEFQEWTLEQLINVAHETGYIRLDVKSFSHPLRNFRNYIHPSKQLRERFNPDKGTAALCFDILKLAIANLSGVSSFK
jgi:hypothetical protein